MVLHEPRGMIMQGFSTAKYQSNDEAPVLFVEYGLTIPIQPMNDNLFVKERCLTWKEAMSME
jgi:hypothetical protein